MPVTDQQIQSLIILEVGEVWQPPTTPGGPQTALLASNIATVWASYADKALIAPRLQELYTKRRCIDIVLATLRDQVDFSVFEDLNSKQGQRFDHLNKMRADCQAEIVIVEQRAQKGRAPAVGPLTNTEPETPPTSLPVTTVVDGNDPRYRGDLYQPSRLGVFR